MQKNCSTTVSTCVNHQLFHVQNRPTIKLARVLASPHNGRVPLGVPELYQTQHEQTLHCRQSETLLVGGHMGWGPLMVRGLSLSSFAPHHTAATPRLGTSFRGVRTNLKIPMCPMTSPVPPKQSPSRVARGQVKYTQPPGQGHAAYLKIGLS